MVLGLGRCAPCVACLLVSCGGNGGSYKSLALLEEEKKEEEKAAAERLGELLCFRRSRVFVAVVCAS